MLNAVQLAAFQPADRWQVEVTEPHQHEKAKTDSEPSARRRLLPIMNNYMGVGLDAHLAMQFHQKRGESPELFSYHQLANKLFCAILHRFSQLTKATRFD